MMKALAQWAVDEFADSKHKEPRTLETADWPHHRPRDIPRQANGFDCGVFALQASSASFCTPYRPRAVGMKS